MHSTTWESHWLGSISMFDGFTADSMDMDDGSIFFRTKGKGEPLLLLHGFPETHVMWHRIAPRLAEPFFVICADLPGYGNSSGSPAAVDHAPHSKRAMAASLVTAMSKLGIDRFMVAG